MLESVITPPAPSPARHHLVHNMVRERETERKRSREVGGDRDRDVDGGRDIDRERGRERRRDGVEERGSVDRANETESLWRWLGARTPLLSNLLD